MAGILTEREVLVEFLELYKSLTCLRDITTKQYSNRRRLILLSNVMWLNFLRSISHFFAHILRFFLFSRQ